MKFLKELTCAIANHKPGDSTFTELGERKYEAKCLRCGKPIFSRSRMVEQQTRWWVQWKKLSEDELKHESAIYAFLTGLSVLAAVVIVGVSLIVKS